MIGAPNDSTLQSMGKQPSPSSIFCNESYIFLFLLLVMTPKFNVSLLSDEFVISEHLVSWCDSKNNLQIYVAYRQARECLKRKLQSADGFFYDPLGGSS